MSNALTTLRTFGLRRRPRSMRTNKRRSAFTLIEALIGLSIMVFAGAVVLMATETSIRSTSDATDRAIATGMARQLMDEILSQPFVANGRSAYRIPLGPVVAAGQNGARDHFSDSGDYCEYESSGPVDMWGVGIGQGDEAGGQRHPNFQLPAGYFDDWHQVVDVYYVSSADPQIRLAAAQASPLRAVEVRILISSDNGGTIELAHVRRVIAHITGAE